MHVYTLPTMALTTVVPTTGLPGWGCTLLIPRILDGVCPTVVCPA